MAPRKLTHELLREIVNLRSAGNSFAEIALLTGVSEGALSTWRRRGKKENGLAGDLTRLLDKTEQEKKPGRLSSGTTFSPARLRNSGPAMK